MTEQIIPDYLSYATENHASDIFIIAGRPLSVKIDGKMSIFGERLMPDDTDRLIHQIYSMAGNRNIDPFLQTGDDDFLLLHSRSLQIPCQCLSSQRGSLAAVIRVIAFRSAGSGRASPYPGGCDDHISEYHPWHGPCYRSCRKR